MVTENNVHFTSHLLTEDATEILAALVESIKEGCLHFQKGTEELILHTNKSIKVDITASKKEEQATISLTLSWKLPENVSSTHTEE